jgi:hypothetical protein
VCGEDINYITQNRKACQGVIGSSHRMVEGDIPVVGRVLPYSQARGPNDGNVLEDGDNQSTLIGHRLENAWPYDWLRRLSRSMRRFTFSTNATIQMTLKILDVAHARLELAHLMPDWLLDEKALYGDSNGRLKKTMVLSDLINDLAIRQTRGERVGVLDCKRQTLCFERPVELFEYFMQDIDDEVDGCFYQKAKDYKYIGLLQKGNQVDKVFPHDLTKRLFMTSWKRYKDQVDPENASQHPGYVDLPYWTVIVSKAFSISAPGVGPIISSATVIIGIGHSNTLWMAWPPTKSNLIKWTEYHSKPRDADDFLHALEVLEGLEIFRQYGKDISFIIPPGYIFGSIAFMTQIDMIGCFLKPDELDASLQSLRWSCSWAKDNWLNDSEKVSSRMNGIEGTIFTMQRWLALLTTEQKGKHDYSQPIIQELTEMISNCANLCGDAECLSRIAKSKLESGTRLADLLTAVTLEEKG